MGQRRTNVSAWLTLRRIPQEKRSGQANEKSCKTNLPEPANEDALPAFDHTKVNPRSPQCCALRRPRADHQTDLAVLETQAGTMFDACLPFGPCFTSNVTF